MKKYLLILVTGLIVSCASNRYVLTDSNQNKRYLIDYIKDLESQNKVTGKPLVVVDGFAFGYEDLKTKRLPISKEDIFEIVCLEKDSEGAKNIYGKRGENGVLLVLTKRSQERLEEGRVKPFAESRVLYLLGDQQIKQEDIQKINPEDIESIEVIKNKDSIRKYTSEDYDGVIIITMKKKAEK